MRKVIIFVVGFILIEISVYAQQDLQFSLQTDAGIFTISKNSENKDFLSMPLATWNKIVAGTKYVLSELPDNRSLFLCVEIADCKNGFCNKGIGFGCSIFDCSDDRRKVVEQVNNHNRFCVVVVTKISGSSVRLVFNDNVDWNSLNAE